MNLIDQFFEKLNQLPMLPRVVQDALQLMQQEDVEMNAIAVCIGRDPMLCLRVLRMSNSAHFGSRGVSSIPDAVALIGLQNLKTLVIASGVTAAFTDIPGLDLNRFWKHSLVTAVLARAIAKEVNLSGETAYIAGLMHGVGQIPLHMVFPMAAKNVEETCLDRCVLERKSIEQSIMGIDHCQVGEILAKKWNFPLEIQQVIRHYVEPMHADATDYAAVVYAAVHIAFDMAHGKEPSYIAETLNPDVRDKLAWHGTQLLAEKIEDFKPLIAEAEQYI